MKMKTLREMLNFTERQRVQHADALRRLVRAPTTVRGQNFELGTDVEKAFGLLRLIGGPGREG